MKGFLSCRNIKVVVNCCTWSKNDNDFFFTKQHVDLDVEQEEQPCKVNLISFISDSHSSISPKMVDKICAPDLQSCFRKRSHKMTDFVHFTMLGNASTKTNVPIKKHAQHHCEDRKCTKNFATKGTQSHVRMH